MSNNPIKIGGNATAGGDQAIGGSINKKGDEVGGSKGGGLGVVVIGFVAVILIFALAYGVNQFVFKGLGIKGGNTEEVQEYGSD